MVAEVEVEESSFCHVRDVCAAEQYTVIIATAQTLHVPVHLPLSMELAFNSWLTSFASSLAWHQRRRKIRMSRRF
jgi:hypothetical protein